MISFVAIMLLLHKYSISARARAATFKIFSTTTF